MLGTVLSVTSNGSNMSNAYHAIQEKRLKPWQGEEEVRYSWMRAIEDATGLHLNAERNRKDSSLNHVIIEFKAPGLFRGRKSSPAFKNATEERLLPYIIRESSLTGIPESDFIGIAIDGDHICFAQVIDRKIETQHLIPFSNYAVDMVIDAFLSDTRRALTTENLLADFGHGSVYARNFMQSMSDGLLHYVSQRENNKVKMLFEEWRTLYGQVADMSIMQTEAINKEIAFSWRGMSEDSISARLFIIHTYNSILIKLLAAEIVSAYGLTSISHPAQSMSALDESHDLIKRLEFGIEGSEVFEQAGIKGFVEEVIFSWYIKLAKDDFIPDFLLGLRQILSRLSLYRLDHLEKTRDVLRDLYHGLIPSRLRQSLGEFYTPDWLVDFTLAQASNDHILSQRVLDPTCGSGAFLLAVIRKKRELATDMGWTPMELLNSLCETVWGFDLNPLAVQTARVNFLMEVADLLKQCPGIDIEIPVLLADAIYSPAASPKGDKQVVEYNIGSQVARLNILLPADLARDRVRLDLVFKRMEAEVETNSEFDSVEQKMIRMGVVSKEEASAWKSSLHHTYDQVLNLHRRQWNGIWFKIVRNFFWSSTAGSFDLVIGNPPWVRWSKLPELYRERVKPTCEHYGIFSKTKRHGGNELDISAMITYTVADKWLKKNGKLAFVITGAIFKNPSSAGFRTFKLEPNNRESLYLQPLIVEDMKALKPFEDASNHTVVAVFEKTAETPVYPVPYGVWHAKQGFRRAIPSAKTLGEVQLSIAKTEKEAFPVSDNGSPWAILDIGRFSTIKYLSRECQWTQGRKGITTDVNGIYFVPVLRDNGKLVEIQSRPEAGRKNIGEKRSQWVEPDLLYPLIKGASDFEECYLKLNSPTYDGEQLFTFVPNIGISGQDYEDSDTKLNTADLKKTLAWFNGFREVLLNRSTYRLQMKGAPFYAIYNVGEYTFKPWKVIWPEMSSSFYAAVAGSANFPLVGNKVYVPDHKVYFSSFDEKQPAYYLCGLLNSHTVKEWINSHNVSIQVANIFKHLDLPIYSEKNDLHIRLAQAVERCHITHEKDQRASLLVDIRIIAEQILLGWSQSA